MLKGEPDTPHTQTKTSHVFIRSATAASWLNEQDWAEVSKRLSSNKHNAEKLVARLKTSSSKIQLFRDGIEAN